MEWLRVKSLTKRESEAYYGGAANNPQKPLTEKVKSHFFYYKLKVYDLI
jgi:hypothetical protein